MALLANVLHDWGPADDRSIVARAYRALSAGGVLLVFEFFLEDDWSGPYKGLTEAMTVHGPPGQSGWQASYGEMEVLLAEVGFADLQRVPGLIVARKG